MNNIDDAINNGKKLDKLFLQRTFNLAKIAACMGRFNIPCNADAYLDNIEANDEMHERFASK